MVFKSSIEAFGIIKDRERRVLWRISRVVGAEGAKCESTESLRQKDRADKQNYVSVMCLFFRVTDDSVTFLFFL